jgi:hypothetical protein
MSFFGGMLVAVGVVLSAVALALKARALRQRAWRKVPGTITTAEVRLIRENYGAVVEYSYAVDGRVFRGDRLQSLSVTSNLRGSVERLVSQYPVGSQITVYVNPMYATESVLIPGGDPSFLIFMLAFALLPLVAGIAMIAIS